MRRIVFASGVLLAGVVLAGCGVGPVSPAVESSSPAPAASGSAAVAGSAAASASAPAVVATRTATVGGADLTFSLSPLRVTGEVMTLDFTVTNRGGRAFSPMARFGNGWVGYNVGAVYVLDLVNARRHLVATSADGGCACSGTLSPVEVGDAVTYSAVFRAVPADVPTVSVVIPLAGTISDVPVTR